MGKQLIFCVETNKKAKTDYIYLSATINNLYVYDRANVRFSPVYMDGKGNYNSKRVVSEIASLKRKYLVTSPDNATKVFYCFDCDHYDSKSDDAAFLQEAQNYCLQNSCEFIWFCRDIEHVYLGKQIPDHDKRNEAIKFKKREHAAMEQIDLIKMSKSKFQPGCSNILCILDKYLIRK